MRVIIGYGNSLRGEDAFGLDVIKELQRLSLKDTKLISGHQLIPEIVLELLDANEIIFIDTCYDEKNNYSLACSLTQQNNLNLSHHISPKTIIQMLNTLYGNHPDFFIYSMMSSSFDEIMDLKKYRECVDVVSKHLECC
jgi:hydrogenase maturation protease